MPHHHKDSDTMAAAKPERDFSERLSKRLCYILRYGAVKEGLTVHEGGMSMRRFFLTLCSHLLITLLTLKAPITTKVVCFIVC